MGNCSDQTSYVVSRAAAVSVSASVCLPATAFEGSHLGFTTLLPAKVWLSVATAKLDKNMNFKYLVARKGQDLAGRTPEKLESAIGLGSF
mmetsp:Transcript_96373/g.171290  ORF Transcript_96373/g.171290 Transcript_96373/m.171290 type:complete len:90 (-) Transcript_96373:12-281(-)